MAKRALDFAERPREASSRHLALSLPAPPAASASPPARPVCSVCRQVRVSSWLGPQDAPGRQGGPHQLLQPQLHGPGGAAAATAAGQEVVARRHAARPLAVLIAVVLAVPRPRHAAADSRAPPQLPARLPPGGSLRKVHQSVLPGKPLPCAMKPSINGICLSNPLSFQEEEVEMQQIGSPPKRAPPQSLALRNTAHPACNHHQHHLHHHHNHSVSCQLCLSS